MIDSNVRGTETEKIGEWIVEYPKARIVNTYMKNEDMFQISNFTSEFLTEFRVRIWSK